MRRKYRRGTSGSAEILGKDPGIKAIFLNTPHNPTGGVTTVPYKPAITAQGKRHPVTRNLPGSEGDVATWGRWLRLIHDRGMEAALEAYSG